MSTDAYREILERLQQLSFAETLRLKAVLEASLRRHGEEKPLHSIMEFEGLGQELWRGVNVDKYLDDERNSWDRQQTEPPKKHKITELRGLGKEIWEGVDAQEYVNHERDSWDK